MSDERNVVIKRFSAALALLGLVILCGPAAAQQPRGAMPSAEATFVPIELAGHVGGLEPVLSVNVGQETKVYPLRILALHGVINDVISGRAMALSYCGPCGTVGAFQRPGNTKLTAVYDARAKDMTLLSAQGQEWSQSSGDGMRTKGSAPAMLSAMPSKVISMARVRQAAAGADGVVLVLQDTDVSRVPTPKTLALPGATLSAGEVDEDNDVAASNKTKVLDARSWSLDLLSPERRLGDEERLILLEDRAAKGAVGPPAP